MDQASVANGELPGFCSLVVISLPQESCFFHVLMGLLVGCAEARRGLWHEAFFVERPGLLDVEKKASVGRADKSRRMAILKLTCVPECCS